MATSPQILLKIKSLMNLTSSSNENEAKAALAMAEKLIAKHSVTEEELKSLQDKKPAYSDEEKLFSTQFIIGWKNQLALAVAKKYDCMIIQEESVPLQGSSEYSYYVYGEPEEVGLVIFVFNALLNRINDMVALHCLGRGAIYVDSYCEGLVQSIKHNLEFDDLDVPKVNRQVKTKPEEVPIHKGTELIQGKTEKESPTDERVDVNSQSFIKDVGAYFKGMSDGRSISLQEALILEAQNEETGRLSEAKSEAQEDST